MKSIYRFAIALVIIIPITTNAARTITRYNYSLSEGATSNVLTIPVGAINPAVFLKADNDSDIEIWAGSPLKKIYGRNASTSGYSKFNYNGDIISGSGYNGRWSDISTDTKSAISKEASLGREFIRVHGKSKNSYTIKVYGKKKSKSNISYSTGDNVIYAGIWGMGYDYLKSESNSSMWQYSASNGLMPRAHKWMWGDKYSAYGHTITQANNISNGLNLPFLNKDGAYNANINSKGQTGVAMRLSNYAKGAGDFSIFSSGGVTWVFNKIKNSINENANNLVYVSGHSSGGGDAQDILWKFNEIGQPIQASFQIDSVETEMANWGDARIPSNTKAAYNYWENNTAYAVIGPRESYIYADNSKKTTINNTQISRPVCNTANNICKEDAHEAIDNDNRVWGDMVFKISSSAGISGFTE